MATQQLTRARVSDEVKSALLAEVAGMTKLVVDDWIASDIEMLGNGALSPLSGFMCQKDYLSVVRDMRLADGTAWPLPITLAVDDDTGAHVRVGDRLALTWDSDGTNETVLAVLTVEDKFRYDKEHEASCVYKTTSMDHPGVRRVMAQGSVLLGGTVQVISERPDQPFSEFRLEPVETRKAFAELGWRTVTGFQTRNPIHRAHEYIQKCALEITDGLLIHPLVGQTKDDDIPADVRMTSYKTIIDGYYPKDRVLLAVYPAAMRYAGPREAIFHAIIRRNYGCTHFIVGRDHAGVGSFYGTYDAQLIFHEFADNELGITPLFFEHTFFCTVCGNMASKKTCPHDPSSHLTLSGTKVRAMLAQGQLPPPEFTRPEVAKVLM